MLTRVKKAKPPILKRGSKKREKDIAQIKKSIRHFRKEKDYSQEDMAEALGVHLNTYAGYENANNKSSFSTEKLLDICEVLAVIPGNLYPLGDEAEEWLCDAEEVMDWISEGANHLVKMRGSNRIKLLQLSKKLTKRR